MSNVCLDVVVFVNVNLGHGLCMYGYFACVHLHTISSTATHHIAQCAALTHLHLYFTCLLIVRISQCNNHTPLFEYIQMVQHLFFNCHQTICFRTL